MDAFARLPSAEREVYFRQASAACGLPPHVIEKDFWVCWTLRRLFALESAGRDLVFKGGTSLSKAYGLIRRFSEDIDLSIDRSSLGFGGASDPAILTGKPFKRADEALGHAARSRILTAILPELEKHCRRGLEEGSWRLGPDEDDPEGQSLSFAYPATGLTPTPSSYLRPAVKIEFGARADHEPCERRAVRPYLEEALPHSLEAPETEVKVICAVRTFWEKATILHQTAHLPAERAIPPRYSRHYYDLAAMIGAGIGERAMEQEALLAAVVAHKRAFYRATWACYETAVRGSLRLVPPPERRAEFERDLGAMSEMFFDNPPDAGHILGVLAAWQEDFNHRSPIIP